MRTLDSKLAKVAYKLVPKRLDNDCAIAALATYLRRDYMRVLREARNVNADCLTDGLSSKEVLTVAQRLGACVCWRSLLLGDYMPGLAGVLWLSYCNHRDTQHCVVLLHGQIFDPDFEPALIEYSEYCRLRGARIEQLLVKLENR